MTGETVELLKNKRINCSTIQTVRIANPIFCRRCVTIVLQRIEPAGASATAEQTDKDGKDHTMYYGHNPKFPDNFMWGASSAAWRWKAESPMADARRAIIDLNSKTKKPFAVTPMRRITIITTRKMWP